MPVPAAQLRVALPAALLAVVVAVDVVLSAGPAGVLVTGVLDEPAHLATAALVLLAARPWPLLVRRRGPLAAVLAAAVLIDLDHVPLYAGVPHVAFGGRPVTHCLVTVAVLALVAVARRGRSGRWWDAAALGVALHLLRDLATGPGVLLGWPLSTREVLLPHGGYLVLLSVLAVVATARAVWDAVRGAVRAPVTSSDSAQAAVPGPPTA